MRKKRLKSRSKRYAITLWILTLLWMLIIFILSAQPAETSNNVSTSLTEGIIMVLQNLDLINEDITNDTIVTVNEFLRQYAHAIAYFILAVFVCNALRYTRVNGFTLYSASFVFCAIYALTDEVHQIFVPGRAFQVRDLIFDSLGALAALALIYLFSRIFRSRIQRPGAVPRQ